MCCSIKLTLLDKTISFDQVVNEYCLLFNIPPSFFMLCLAGFQFYVLSLPQTTNISKRRDRCVDLILPNLLNRTLSHTKIPHFPLFEFLRKSFPYSYLKMNFFCCSSEFGIWPTRHSVVIIATYAKCQPLIIETDI